MSSNIDDLMALASNPKPVNTRIHRNIDGTHVGPSSVVAAGPGAAEAAIMKKAEDPNAMKQPSVGVSNQNE